MNVTGNPNRPSRVSGTSLVQRWVSSPWLVPSLTHSYSRLPASQSVLHSLHKYLPPSSSGSGNRFIIYVQNFNILKLKLNDVMYAMLYMYISDCGRNSNQCLNEDRALKFLPVQNLFLAEGLSTKME